LQLQGDPRGVVAEPHGEVFGFEPAVLVPAELRAGGVAVAEDVEELSTPPHADVVQGHLSDEDDLVGGFRAELGHVGLEAVLEGLFIAVGQHLTGAGQAVLQ
jgi:hypothetical protein